MQSFDDFDRLDESPTGYSERETTPRMLRAVSDERILEVVGSMSEDDLAAVRERTDDPGDPA